MNKQSLCAFYTHDFEYFDRTIGDSLFFYNPSTQCFEMGGDKEVSYSLEMIEEMNDWIFLWIDREFAGDFEPADQSCQTKVIEKSALRKTINKLEEGFENEQPKAK
ncbi:MULTISPECIES: hypothetical protein [unclassified Lactococcus]|uniref:hypothetical protein n=1 Tax=unclassified Lactococcus TaxID=2643510 RepID=UPI0011C80BB1|nr:MULTISPECIES: hypothetical protein [unclassified Lactococcus]MQW23218.1 hypothetical protein [Lactococcus sp. dk101]TXK38111.1 hypothetical protein FVP42_06795 [Lactococcus sp. dk310]TXK49790.1 hypothetical protein FVP43_06765 [Lactococcus sp. dk322]